MADYPELDISGDDHRPSRIIALLDALGWIVLVGPLLAGAYLLYDTSQSDLQGPALTGRWVTAAGLILGGPALGVALWGLAELVRRNLRLEELSEDLANALAQRSSDTARSREEALEREHSFDELVLLLREVRDISLLDPEQRMLRLKAQGRAMLERLRREVPVLLREHNWIEARNRVQEARARFPTFPEWDELEQQIERVRSQVEQHDIESAQRQIDELVSLGAWDRVEEVLKELLQRHPDSARANELAHNLRARRHQAEAELRARLMAQAQECVNRRDWAAALRHATALIQRFPKSPEAQALRMQLPTLRENAEIKERQRMEAEIRELIQQQRFDGALRIARQLLEQYPHSPQAEVLRQQIPKLEQRAATARG